MESLYVTIFWEMLEKLVKHAPLTTRTPPVPDIILINDARPLWKMTIAGSAVNALDINAYSSASTRRHGRPLTATAAAC